MPKKSVTDRMGLLKAFYRARSKKGPSLYDYDESGDLVIKDEQGGIQEIIPIPRYREVTLEEREAMEKERMVQIQEAIRVFDQARRELHAEIHSPESTEATILELNRKVALLDKDLQTIRFPLRSIIQEENVMIRKIDFSQPNETRRYAYPISVLETAPFPLQAQYVREGEAPSKPMVTLAEAKANSKRVLLFSDARPEPFTLNWPIQLEFHSTMYPSARHAILAEIAKSFGDEEAVQRIMTTEEASELDYSVENVPGDIESNRVKWNALMSRLLVEVNWNKFRQYPDLAQQLLMTYPADLGAYEPNDTIIGIGISPEDPRAMEVQHWVGQNQLGVALMDIRERLRAEGVAVQPQGLTLKKRSKKSQEEIKEDPATYVKSVKQSVEQAMKPSLAKPSLAKPSLAKPSLAFAKAAPAAVTEAALAAVPAAEPEAEPAAASVLEDLPSAVRPGAKPSLAKPSLAKRTIRRSEPTVQDI